jgi:hypothetical protein
MKVDIKPLKQRALTFPEPLRTLILSESDEMDSNEFILKVGTWSKIAKMPQNGGPMK